MPNWVKSQAVSSRIQHGARRFCIYALLESGKHVRYIGITKQKPERRLLQHYADASRKRTDHKANWIRQCLAEGIPIEIKVIRGGLSEDEAARKEVGLIRFFGKAFRLVNSHEGGSSGYAGLSPESKAKHRASGKARFQNPLQKAWALEHVKALHAAKARKRMAEPDFKDEVQHRERCRRAKAKWRLQIRDLEHGDSLTLLLYRLPWPARYAGSDGREHSAAGLGRSVATLLREAE